MKATGFARGALQLVLPWAIGCGGSDHPLVSRSVPTPDDPAGATPSIALLEAVNTGRAWRRGSRVDGWLIGNCCAVTTAPAAVDRSLDECPASLVQANVPEEITDDKVLWTCRNEPGFLVALLPRPPIGTRGSALSTMAPTPGAAVTVHLGRQDIPALVIDVRTDRFTLRLMPDEGTGRLTAGPHPGTAVVFSSTGTLAGVVELLDLDAGLATAVSAGTLARLMLACEHTALHHECLPAVPMSRQVWAFFSDWKPWLAVALTVSFILYRVRPRLRRGRRAA